MDEMMEMYAQLGIDEKTVLYCEEKEKELQPLFAQIDRTAVHNQMKVLLAFQKNRVSAEHMSGSTGYGYNDAGRDTLESVYADVFHTQAALVRPQITCGTHALALALAANLLPGDELLSISGKPYDTLEEVIGIRPSRGSLSQYGVTYRQVELTPSGAFDPDAIRAAIRPETKMVAIQRSRGYLNRPTLSPAQIGEAIKVVKDVRSDILCMVDNCYGEFTCMDEPSDYGADMTVGSLIKNPGGGLAPTGGYIAGTSECIENCSYRLTSPGLGREVGATMDMMRSLYQGLFLAPSVTAAALKGAVFAAAVYHGLGYTADPLPDAPRYDIIQSIIFHAPEPMCAFCRGIQYAAPVDSYVTPQPWPMPGYDSDVIMAAGAFIQGSSIELSADGPMREPYTVYMQGGLTWPHVRVGVMRSLAQLRAEGLA